MDALETKIDLDLLVMKFVLKRTSIKMSQKELARRADVGITSLIKIENFYVKPSIMALLKIYKVLNLELKVIDKDET